jgi:hypothetical protein
MPAGHFLCAKGETICRLRWYSIKPIAAPNADTNTPQNKAGIDFSQ